MRLMIALRSFFKAWKDPAAGEKFLAPREENLSILAKLQQEGRLVDFFQEEISGYQDADIGLCVRKIHQDCNKVLKEIAIAPVVPADEGASFTVPSGYDPVSIKVIGNAAGSPPFTGVVRHKGWTAQKFVLQPAEIEIR